MSDLQQLIHVARKAGWSVQKRQGGHLCWRPPGRGAMVFSASSPSDCRALPNLRACLRRAGLHTDGAENHGQK